MTYLTKLNSFYNLSYNRKTRLLLSTHILISKRTMMSTIAKIGGSTVKDISCKTCVSYTFLNKSTKIFIPKRFTGGKKTVEAIGKAIAENQSTTTRATANAMNSKNLSTNNSFKDPGEVSKNTPSEKSLPETAKEDLVKPSFLKGTPKSLREQVEETYLNPEDSARHKTQNTVKYQESVDTQEESVETVEFSEEYPGEKTTIQSKSDVQYRVGRLNPDTHISSAFRNKDGIAHELTHDVVVKHSGSEIPEAFAITTSATASKHPGFIKVSAEKFDGSYVPLKTVVNKKTPDDYGNVIPKKDLAESKTLHDDYADPIKDSTKGGQFIAPLKHRRYLEAENAYSVNNAATEKINSPAIFPIIEQIDENTKNTTPISRRLNDDPSFYNEDGRSIADVDNILE